MPGGGSKPLLANQGSVIVPGPGREDCALDVPGRAAVLYVSMLQGSLWGPVKPCAPSTHNREEVMKLLRTVIVFVAGLIIGYTVRAWDIDLPDQVAGYADQIDRMKEDKARLEKEIERLRKIVDDVD